MSYVLEALRRAEAQRQRGRVPGLEAQPLAPPAPTAAPTAPGRWPLLAGAGLLLLAGAGGAWLWLAASAPDRTPAAGPTPVPAAPPVLPTTPATDPAPPPAGVARVQPPAAPALRPLPPAPAPVDEKTAARPGPMAGPKAGPGVATGRALRPQELPEPDRRQFPALAFGGAIDSPQPEARMLVINGQVWREGEQPAPGLLLERITLRSATFRWRSHRVEVPLDGR
jgi:general secretion pathway protein B